MSPRTVEVGLRSLLDKWQFWMGVAYFGIVALIVWGVHVNGVQTRLQAARQAEQKAAAQSQVSDCFQRVTTAPALLGILDSLELIVQNSITTTEAALAADPDSPLTDVRRRSLERSRKALDQIRDFAALTSANTPTPKECKALADRLGVERPKAVTDA